MKTNWKYLLFLVVIIGCSFGLSHQVLATSIIPKVYPDTVNCQTFQYPFSFIPNSLNSGTYSYANDSATLTLANNNGTGIDYSSNPSVDVIIVKGNGQANVYFNPSSFIDTGLTAPTNSTGAPSEISGIEFCYRTSLKITNYSVTPSLDRTYNWTITKNSSINSLNLPLNQSVPVDYSVTATANLTDSNWKFHGTFSIFNPAPIPVDITNISSSITPDFIPLSANRLSISCSKPLPITLQAGESVPCQFELLEPLANGTNFVYVVAIDSSINSVPGISYPYLIEFNSPWNTHVTEIDNNIIVNDNMTGQLGIVNKSESPKTFNYTLNVGPYNICGDYQFINTASFTTNDTHTIGQSNYPLNVAVACVINQCVYGQGYWKNHPANWPISSLSLGLNQYSKDQLVSILKTPVNGNGLISLAHQLIATKLNLANGATIAPIKDAINGADNLIGQSSLPASTSLPVNVSSLVDKLDTYNNIPCDN